MHDAIETSQKSTLNDYVSSYKIKFKASQAVPHDKI